jgi:glycosyltransferase involved in cell wall biosynthesis
MRVLTAIPVYNEAKHVTDVLAEVRRYSPNILVVNDGSTDGTGELLNREPGILRIDHHANSGYGAALISAFAFALAHDFDVLVTMDCDGQHQPERIPVLLEAIDSCPSRPAARKAGLHGRSACDIVSGSRYLRDFRQDTLAPSDRQLINATITREINARYGLNLTDAFCGFKAYRRSALEKLNITERGWGMPLQLWVQAARQQLRVKEIGVPRLYLDPNRAFGGVMNDPEQRLAYYREVLTAAERDVLPAARAAHHACPGSCG